MSQSEVYNGADWGPGLAGFAVGLALYGVSVFQCLFYIVAFPKDKRTIKSAVFLVFFSGQRQYPRIFMLLLSNVDSLSTEHGISSHERDDLFDYCLCYKFLYRVLCAMLLCPQGLDNW